MVVVAMCGLQCSPMIIFLSALIRAPYDGTTIESEALCLFCVHGGGVGCCVCFAVTVQLGQ